MNDLKRGLGLLIGLLFILPITGLMFLGDALFNLAFVPFDLFNWMTGILPGPLITFGIDTMIDTFLLLGINVADNAKTAEQAIAVLQFVGIGFVAGAIYFELLRSKRVRPSVFAGVVAGTLFGLPQTVIALSRGGTFLSSVVNAVWLGVVFIAWGVGISEAYRRLRTTSTSDDKAEAGTVQAQQISRRGFILSLGAASASLTVISAGVGVALSAGARRRLLAAGPSNGEHSTEGPRGEPFPNADDPIAPAPGTRPEYTPVKDHYQVFIEVEPTVIGEQEWRLPVVGLVDNPLMLSLQELKDNFPPRNQYVTLSCISGRIGTSLISTTYWTGLSVQDLLAEAQVRPEARYMRVTSADGFHEIVDLDLVNSDPRIMFCYGWDGNDLPVGHGFPLRIWIPDRYGMKQPKWITGVELVEDYTEGYWVERGWDEAAIVKTTSVIDTVADQAIFDADGQRLIPVGGIAFAGARGISSVELRVDGGEWQPAQLRQPLSETTWVIWRYDWPFQEGDHTFEVRCVDGQGNRQIEEANDARPSGATGIHEYQATV